ncbi:hypothetical protein RQP46_001538 [Phenoliferia psychrophenolica]
MNSLGAGGEETPWLVNASNAETFCLMVVTAFLTSALTNKVGVKLSLAIGASGSSYSGQHFAGSVQAFSGPFRVLGPIVGGAINLGLNVHTNTAGKVNHNVYLAFIAIQAVGPFVAFALPSPNKVQRTDGVAVRLFVNTSTVHEIKETAKLFFSRKFLLLVPFITQAVFPESFTYTYNALYFSVRARALGSFLGALVAIVLGNVLGVGQSPRISDQTTRARYSFIAIVAMQGAWWTWSTVIQNEYQPSGTLLDWTDEGFGRGFALYIFLTVGFQLNYLYAYFLVGNLVTEPQDIIRIAGLLRATESAAQAVSYGLNSLSSFGTIGASALNFGLWGVAILPAWLVVKEVGVTFFGRSGEEYQQQQQQPASDSKSPSLEEK